jgi:hypothetical protein
VVDGDGVGLGDGVVEPEGVGDGGEVTEYVGVRVGDADADADWLACGHPRTTTSKLHHTRGLLKITPVQHSIHFARLRCLPSAHC